MLHPLAALAKAGRAILLATVACCPLLAAAQAYPTKPLRVYTQFGPGAPGDVFARILAAGMGNALGQPVVIDSRPGGGGVLVASLATRAENDGYTLVMLTATVPVSSVIPSKTPLPFDPARDLTPVALLIDAASLLVASSESGIRSVPELIAYAKKNPGRLAYGTTGVASSHHLNGEQLAMLTGIQLVHAPYKSTPVADAASGVLPLTFAIVAQAMPFIRSGKVRPLAMTTERRIKTLPDVPLMSEVVPGFDPTPAWTGLYGPARLPAPISKRVHEAVVAALSPADVQAKISDIGFDVALSNSPEDFAARLQRGIDLTARIVKAAKIEAQ